MRASMVQEGPMSHFDRIELIRLFYIKTIYIGLKLYECVINLLYSTTKNQVV